MNSEVQRRWLARRSLWQEAFRGVDLANKRILDAGTGEGHFTRFLAEHKPASLVSITCDPHHAEQAQRRFESERIGPVEVRVADLTAMPQIANENFDVVAGDFLIASLSAYTPYREMECLKELHRVLAPGGRLVLTGWEVWPEVRNRTELQLRRLFKFREACHHLCGSEPYREHPRAWLEARLAELGTPAERIATVPDVHHDVGWLTTNIRQLVESISVPYLRDAMRRRLEELSNPLQGDPAFAVGLEFGRLYAVVACKLAGAILL